jgi:hypothetical protein
MMYFAWDVLIHGNVKSKLLGNLYTEGETTPFIYGQGVVSPRLHLNITSLNNTST